MGTLAWSVNEFRQDTFIQNRVTAVWILKGQLEFILTTLRLLKDVRRLRGAKLRKAKNQQAVSVTAKFTLFSRNVEYVSIRGMEQISLKDIAETVAYTESLLERLQKEPELADEFIVSIDERVLTEQPEESPLDRYERLFLSALEGQ